MSSPAQESPAPVSAEAYAELAELAGRLVHEIKNHLGSLTLNVQLLMEDLEPAENPAQRRALQRARKLRTECAQLTDLSNDFLRFARLGDMNPQPANLKTVIEEILDFYAPGAAAANIDLHSFIPGDLPTVQLDKDLFKQAALNLMLNAEKAMPEGGQLTIQAEVVEDEIVVSFIDTGVGISADVLKEIFRPFFTTKKEGSGLGLPTTRRIVEAHAGRIVAESAPGKGTKFSLYLPVV